MRSPWSPPGPAGCRRRPADQDEPVGSARAHRLLGRRPRHVSFADAPGLYRRAWKAARRTA
ncbi:hypothetical protein QFZ75_007494 [Streptomyces sp. V3I8]|uniref:hypothetical protein n=1 Tax=Streptomyces sp. V3I8 TaxID=3042279 RepID=UPI002783AE75|nr:hypothetical protein [Streptomyces sp. V3I8]MDQ1041078.1 hypothetical protein [Streptomyces sp. V3I8]